MMVKIDPKPDGTFAINQYRNDKFVREVASFNHEKDAIRYYDIIIEGKMKNPITHLRLRLRFIASHEDGLETVAKELEDIAAHLREAKPTQCLRRLPMALHSMSSEEARTVQYIGEVDFHWKDGRPS